MKSPEPAKAAALPPSDAARLRTLFDSRLIGVDLVDAEGRWFDVNDRLCTLLGRSREHLVGSLVEDVTHPDDADVEQGHLRRLVDGEAASYRMRKRLLRGDGRWVRVEVEVSLVPGGEAGPWRSSIVQPVAVDVKEPDEGDARYRVLMAQSPLSVVVVDPETGEFLDFNDAACDSLGYSRREFAGLTLRDVFADDVHEALLGWIGQVIEEGRGRFEARHRTKAGEIREVTVHSRRIRSGGRVVVQSVWQDVTRLREAALEKARHDALVRQILHSAPLPMGIVELPPDDGDILHVFDNPATCRSFGLSPGETSGRWDGADFHVPRSTIRTWVAAYRASERLGHAVHFEDRHDHEGGRRWLGVVVSHVGRGSAGRERFCYIAEDITERKDAEEEILRLNRSLERQAAELQAVFGVLPIGVGIADDPLCRSIRANSTLSNLLDIPAGENISLTAPKPERPTSFRVFRDGVEVAGPDLPMQVSAMHGVAFRDVELDVVFDDGRVVKLQENVVPLFDEKGAPRGSVGTFLDVTERRRAEAERERLLQNLQDADRRKDEFLAMLAHELRSPLAAACNAAQILQMKQPGDHDSRWCVEVVCRQTHRLARLLDDLLDVSRISQGKITLRREVMDLRAAVEHAVETTRPMVEAKRHRIELRTPSSPLLIEADPARIEQVVINLVGNAAKYSEEGKTIRIVVERQPGAAAVRVDDEGLGMAPETLKAVFEPFAQAEGSLDRSQGGLGIGLTISRSLIELHGGTLTAASLGVGLGSSFLIRLPQVDRASADQASAPRAPSSSVVARRILVVDDSDDAAESLARLLRIVGHDVRTAVDGPSGLAAAAAFRPEFVILDLGLPGMDGFELAMRIRKELPGRPPWLIALTGYGSEADRRRALEAGFDRHLIKPVDLDALVALIDSPPADA